MTHIYFIGKSKLAIHKEGKEYTVYRLTRGSWIRIASVKSEVDAKLLILQSATQQVALNSKLEDWEY